MAVRTVYDDGALRVMGGLSAPKVGAGQAFGAGVQQRQEQRKSELGMDATQLNMEQTRQTMRLREEAAKRAAAANARAQAQTALRKKLAAQFSGALSSGTGTRPRISSPSPTAGVAPAGGAPSTGGAGAGEPQAGLQLSSSSSPQLAMATSPLSFGAAVGAPSTPAGLQWGPQLAMMTPQPGGTQLAMTPAAPQRPAGVQTAMLGGPEAFRMAMEANPELFGVRTADASGAAPDAPRTLRTAGGARLALDDMSPALRPVFEQGLAAGPDPLYVQGRNGRYLVYSDGRVFNVIAAYDGQDPFDVPADVQADMRAQAGVTAVPEAPRTFKDVKGNTFLLDKIGPSYRPAFEQGLAAGPDPVLISGGGGDFFVYSDGRIFNLVAAFNGRDPFDVPADVQDYLRDRAGVTAAPEAAPAAPEAAPAAPEAAPEAAPAAPEAAPAFVEPFQGTPTTTNIDGVNYDVYPSGEMIPSAPATPRGSPTKVTISGVAFDVYPNGAVTFFGTQAAVAQPQLRAVAIEQATGVSPVERQQPPASPEPLTGRAAESAQFRANVGNALSAAGDVYGEMARGLFEGPISDAAGVYQLTTGIGLDLLGAGASLVGADRTAAFYEQQSDSLYNQARSNIANGISATAGLDPAQFNMEPAEFKKVIAAAETGAPKPPAQTPTQTPGVKVPGTDAAPEQTTPQQPTTGATDTPPDVSKSTMVATPQDAPEGTPVDDPVAQIKADEGSPYETPAAFSEATLGDPPALNQRLTQAYDRRDVLLEGYKAYSEAGFYADAQKFAQEIQTLDAALDVMEGNQGLNDAIYYNDPRRLTYVLSRSSLGPVEVQAFRKGEDVVFTVFTPGGQPLSPQLTEISRDQLSSAVRPFFDSEYRAQIAEINQKAQEKLAEERAQNQGLEERYRMEARLREAGIIPPENLLRELRDSEISGLPIIVEEQPNGEVVIRTPEIDPTTNSAIYKTTIAPAAYQ